MHLRKKINSEKIVFITGSSKGIGFATTEKCAQEGFKVIATARSPENHPKLLALEKNIRIFQLKN